jgi:integrase
MDFPTILPTAMASIFKRPHSPFWFCSYRSGDGRWLKKSTKQTDRRKAIDFCLKLDQAEQAALARTLTTAQARRLFNEVLERVGDEPLEDFTIREWALEWLKGKETSHAQSTAERYRKPVQDFVAHLVKRADLPLRAANPKDVRSFRDALRRDGRAAATVNFAHKAIASVFEAARRQGFIDANPAHAVDYLPTHPERVEKGTFSPEEVASCIAAAPSEDWRGAILLGYFAGLRLRDSVSLAWGNVDLPSRALSLIPRKTARTGKKLLIPMHPQLEEFFLKHPLGKRDSDPIFPSLYRLSVGGNRGASRTFQSIMAKAGVASGTLREKAGKSGRNVAERSFHSLRHTYITALSTAGVAIELRQKLGGHTSEGQSLHYTHPEFAALRNAIEKLPRVMR